MWAALKMYQCLKVDLLEDEIRDRSIGINDDGSHFVIADLLQQRRRVQVVIQHPDRQRLPGDEKASDQFLQSQQAWGRARCISMSASGDLFHISKINTVQDGRVCVSFGTKLTNVLSASLLKWKLIKIESAAMLSLSVGPGFEFISMVVCLLVSRTSQEQELDFFVS